MNLKKMRHFILPLALLTIFISCSSFKFKESPLAHQLLDGLHGIEVGGSAHNPFGLKTINVDFEDNTSNAFKQGEKDNCGECLKVDLIASGDELPFKDNAVDFVISSHVIEHFFDPIKTIKEWLRVVRPGGYVYMIVPHKERTFDAPRPRTTLQELLQRHYQPETVDIVALEKEGGGPHGHYSVWITEDFIEFCQHFNWNVVAVQDVDDKVGNGFTVVLQKPEI